MSYILSPGRGVLGRNSTLGKPGVLGRSQAGVGSRQGVGGSGGASSGVALPAQANIALHFDLTDLSTMWTDTGRTTQVVNDGDNLRAIDNLGSLSVDLLQVAGNPAQWDSTEVAMEFFGNSTLFDNPTPNGAGGGGSIAILGVRRSVTTNLTEFPVTWDGVQVSGRLTYAAGIPSDLVSNPYTVNGISATTSPSHGVYVSWVGTDDGANSQTGDYSTQAGQETGAGASVIPSTPILVLGALSTGGGNGWTGWIKEIVIWDGYTLNSSEISEVKAYDTAKHGTIWV